MDRAKRDLEALVSSQKEQLSRYEKRLKDVVTAYKGLLKEKEALETSLAAISNSKPIISSSTSENDVSDAGTSEAPIEATPEKVDCADDKNQLQSQIMTLMSSLATLSAEKSRMEASFQADKKQLRAQLAHKDKTIGELQAKINEIQERSKNAVDEMKAKWIIERQEREQETNNQMIMIRELQKLYADERHLKENIEMQLNNFKTQFASDEAENSRVKELQAQLRECKAQLKQLQGVQKDESGYEKTGNSAILKQVQQEMQQLKEQHAVAIKCEQRRVHLAEERSKKLAALHEDRVANLEARLAELSTTVGTYDRLRQQDQKNIQELKQKLQNIDTNHSADNLTTESYTFRRSSATTPDISKIVDEILRLKALLISENGRSKNPIDLNQLLSVGADHSRCQDDLNRALHELETARTDVVHLEEKVQVQKSHISTLQEKVMVLNRNIDEQEQELRQQGEKQQQAVKDERCKWKEALEEMENECRCKIYEMEQQLQKQRQRSLQLLDEKEQEIKTLQTSFEVFHSTTMPTVQGPKYSVTDHYAASSDAESDGGPTATNGGGKTGVKSKKLSVGENCHMLHYANEIARKDIEITGLRKAKYAAETAMRKAIHEKVTAQEELCDKIAALEEQVDRLERCKTREGANLEYLKNVIISFITTKDPDGKQHMMNAISAVLQFTSAEIQVINAAFPKK